MAEAVADDRDKSKSEVGRKKLVLIGAPVLLVLACAVLWVTGVLPLLLGRAPAQHAMNEAPAPVFIDLPEIVANLDFEQPSAGLHQAHGAA